MVPQENNNNNRSPGKTNKSIKRQLFYVPPFDVPPSVMADAASKTRTNILQARETTLQGIDNSVLRVLSGSAQAPHEMLGIDLFSLERGFRQVETKNDKRHNNNNLINNNNKNNNTSEQSTLGYNNASEQQCPLNKKHNLGTDGLQDYCGDNTNHPAANLTNGTFYRYKYLVPGGIAELRSKIMSEKGGQKEITKVCEDTVRFWGPKKIGHSQILDDFLPFVSDSSRIVIVGRGELLSEILSQIIKIHTGARFYVMECLPEMPHEALVRLEREQQKADNKQHEKRQPQNVAVSSSIGNKDPSNRRFTTDNNNNNNNVSNNQLPASLHTPMHRTTNRNTNTSSSSQQNHHVAFNVSSHNDDTSQSSSLLLSLPFAKTPGHGLIDDAVRLYPTHEQLIRNSCRIVPDGCAVGALAQADIVVTGAYAVTANGGIVHRAGTMQLCMLAKTLQKPVYVLCESYKFTSIYPLKSQDIAQPAPISIGCSNGVYNNNNNTNILFPSSNDSFGENIVVSCNTDISTITAPTPKCSTKVDRPINKSNNKSDIYIKKNDAKSKSKVLADVTEQVSNTTTTSSTSVDVNLNLSQCNNNNNNTCGISSSELFGMTVPTTNTEVMGPNRLQCTSESFYGRGYCSYRTIAPPLVHTVGRSQLATSTGSPSIVQKQHQQQQTLNNNNVSALYITDDPIESSMYDDNNNNNNNNMNQSVNRQSKCSLSVFPQEPGPRNTPSPQEEPWTMIMSGVVEPLEAPPLLEYIAADLVSMYITDRRPLLPAGVINEFYRKHGQWWNN